MEAIEKRRSVRNFDGNFVIPEETLQHLINATQNSPTALNYQEIDTIFITNKALITKINDASWNNVKDKAMAGQFLDWQKKHGVKNILTYDCSALVLFVKNGERAKAPDLVGLDAGIATGILISATEAAGLNSVPIGMLANPLTEEIAGLEAGSLVMTVAIGKTKRLDVDSKQFLNKATLIE